MTNDDGVDSVGLHILARAMRRHGDVVVIAPDREYSGASAALGTLHLIRPEVHRVHIEGVDEAWAVTGPPALCVMFARLGAFGAPFDLVVSGINPGANVGRSVYHSGTIGAAYTGRIGNISGVAVSQAVTGWGVEGQAWEDMLVDQRWHTAAAVADAFVEGLVADLPTEPVVVNINVPNCELTELRGWRHTALGTDPPRRLSSAVLEPLPGHEDAYLVAMTWGEPVELPIDTDGGTVERNMVSITYLSRITAAQRSDMEASEKLLSELLGAP